MTEHDPFRKPVPTPDQVRGRRFRGSCSCVAPERGGRAVSLVTSVSAAGGTDVAFVFRWVFLAAWIFLAIGLIALILMAERPLRTSTVPTEPKPAPPQSPVPAE